MDFQQILDYCETLLAIIWSQYQDEIVRITWLSILITAGSEGLARWGMAQYDAWVKGGTRRDAVGRAVGMNSNFLIAFLAMQIFGTEHGWAYHAFWVSVYGGIAAMLHLILERRIRSIKIKRSN